MPLARDLGHYGIRVMTISGGGTKEQMEKATSAEMLRFIKSQIPLGDFPLMENFCQLFELVVRTASLNAEVVRYDGGLRLPHL